MMAYELCSPALIDTVVAETFDNCLSDAGFQKIRPRYYVRTRFREMNDVIKFYRSYLDLNFVWGVSLNFVPHITTGVEDVPLAPNSKVSGHRPRAFRIWQEHQKSDGRFGRHKERRNFVAALN